MKLHQVTSMPRRFSKHEPTEGQIACFHLLKSCLAPFTKALKEEYRIAYRYELWAEPRFSITTNRRNRKRQRGVLFAGISIQKTYVGLYFFPLQVDSGLKDIIYPKLKSFLKGESAFHFDDLVKLEPDVITGIDVLLEIGMKTYKELGWVK